MAECMRCFHELVEVENMDEGYDIEVKEYKCPHCGAIEICYPCSEEDRKDYAFYDETVEDNLGGCSHGYPGLCPICGSHIIWGADFMRSEVLGDVDEDDLNEYGIPKDDSLATNVSCPHCGALIDIIDAKPSEYKLYPFYNEDENKD